MSGGQSTASGTTASGETARTDVTEAMGVTGVPDVSSVTGARQVELPEDRHAEELAFLAAYDEGPRPPGWRLTPRAVVTFVCGSDGEALSGVDGRRLVVSRKFVGDRGLVERCVVTLAGERGLLLVGEPGTAKSMLSELLAAAVCGTSALTVQGTAGTTEDQLRYGWNYAMLLAAGPSRAAMVPSPVLTAMTREPSPGSRRSRVVCPRCRTPWCPCCPNGASRYRSWPHGPKGTARCTPCLGSR